MIESFDVSDFRCFEKVALSGLGRVNILTGANASGKSAFLEALYLALNGTAQALQNINLGRLLVQPVVGSVGSVGGLQFPLPIPFMGAVTTNFDNLFRSYRIKTVTGSEVRESTERAKKIAFSFRDSDHTDYILTVAYQSAGGDGEPVPVVRIPGGLSSVVPLLMDRTKAVQGKNTERQILPVTVNNTGQLSQPQASPFGPSTYIFGPGMDYAESDNVTWFSQLRERNEAEPIIDFLRGEFPFIKDIEVLAPSGNSGLYANLIDGSSRKITMLSSGIYKLISILLGCASIRNGVIFIDEIENGIFYEKYKSIWQILYRFAIQTQNQFFISSHSAECLTALAPEIDGKEKDFQLLRAERINGKCTVTQISGAAIKSALMMGGDVRGSTLGKTSRPH